VIIGSPVSDTRRNPLANEGGVYAVSPGPRPLVEGDDEEVPPPHELRGTGGRQESLKPRVRPLDTRIMAIMLHVRHVEAVWGHGIVGDIRGQLGGIHDAGTAGGIRLDIANGYIRLMPADVEAVRGDGPTEAGGRGDSLYRPSSSRRPLP
jgi:hypothetical protein